MSDAFLTIDEAAGLLRISPRSAYTLARRGELAGAVKVGNQWRVDRDALMASNSRGLRVPSNRKHKALSSRLPHPPSARASGCSGVRGERSLCLAKGL